MDHTLAADEICQKIQVLVQLNEILKESEDWIQVKDAISLGKLRYFHSALCYEPIVVLETIQKSLSNDIQYDIIFS